MSLCQPYVGRPPTTGAALTVRTAPDRPLASSWASFWPSASSTGCAACFAFSGETASLVPLSFWAEVSPPSGQPGPLACEPLPPPFGAVSAQPVPPGVPYCEYVHAPEPPLATSRTGLRASRVRPPTFQESPSERTVPGRSRAFASRATASWETSPRGW